jgi:hypothetical protein
LKMFEDLLIFSAIKMSISRCRAAKVESWKNYFIAKKIWLKKWFLWKCKCLLFIAKKIFSWELREYPKNNEWFSKFCWKIEK